MSKPELPKVETIRTSPSQLAVATKNCIMPTADTRSKRSMTFG